MPYDRFHLGYKQMDLAPDELIVSIRVVRGRGGWVHGWRKVGTRRAQAISKVCFAGAVEMSGGVVHDVRLAYRQRGPDGRPRGARRGRDSRTRAQRRGDCAACCEALERDIEPIDDIRSTAAYRMRVAANLLREFLAS